VQEGEQPAEKPDDLLKEIEQVALELRELIQRINRTNAATVFGTGSLTDALAERDVLSRRRAAYGDMANAAALRHDRYSRTDVKFVATVDVAALRKQADDLARAYRELDARI